MTTPKVNTIHRAGSRFYVRPATGAKAPGVTSVIGMLPKGFLKFWAAKAVATSAVDMLPELVGMAVKGQQAAAIDMLKRAPDRDVNQAAENGTAAHDAFEILANGQPLGRIAPAIRVYADHFAEFLDSVQPTILHTEQTVWSETHDYAGSFDGFGLIPGNFLGLEDPTPVPTWLDWKTTRSGVHEEVALQLAAYGNADYIVSADGTTTPLPIGQHGAVVHVRPEGWKLVPVTIDADVFKAFLFLRGVFDWDTDGKKSVLGREVISSDILAAARAATPAPAKAVKPSARIAASRRKAITATVID